MMPPKTLSYLLLLLMTCCSLFAEETDDDDAAEKEKFAQEELEEKKKTDALIQAQFGYSLDDICNKLVVIKHKMGSGNGFIAAMDGKTYLFTNQHIILGAEKLSFKTATGELLRPRSVELSSTRDIARLLLADGTEGFGVSADIPMDSPAGVFGSSDIDDGVAELYGTITGVGAEIVEVSADFIEENSGSPVLNIDQEVLGIASYVRESNAHSMKTGTQFENSTRRFCYRLANTQWKSVNWKIYNEKYGAFYRQNTQFVDGIIELFINWVDTPKDRVSIKKHPEQSLISWAESHNKIIAKYSLSKKKRFASEYSESLSQLSKKCSNRARQTRLLSEQPELTKFLQEELNMQAGTLEYAAKTLNRISTRAQDYR